MSQNDMDIATADANTGILVRAAINAALQALASSNSGATAPSTPYGNQLWADTVNSLLKIRNTANDAWITIGDLSTTGLALLAKSGGNMSGAINEASTSIASGSTVDIASAGGNFIEITGSATITTLGTAQKGAHRILVFGSTNTLSYNATSLILPTSSSIAVNAGDIAGFESLGSGNWRCAFYTRADGTPLKASIATAGGFVVNTTYQEFIGNASTLVNTTSLVVGPNTTVIFVTGTAPGSGGGASVGVSGKGGSGGGSGEWVQKKPVPVVAGSTYTIVIGGAGTAGTSQNGGPSGNITIADASSNIIFQLNGSTAGGVQGGGAGGTRGIGIFGNPGSTGAVGQQGSGASGGGSGASGGTMGPSARTSSTANDGSASYGPGIFGLGGISPVVTNVGGNGQGYGSGGSGGSGGDVAGGIGAPGYLCIEWNT